jgi:hypothetical protein
VPDNYRGANLATPRICPAAPHQKSSYCVVRVFGLDGFFDSSLVIFARYFVPNAVGGLYDVGKFIRIGG